MDKFFNYLRKGLVGTLFVMFATVATYVPIPHTNNVPEAGAALPTFDAAAVGQAVLNIAAWSADNVIQTAKWVLDKLQWAKDSIGDGIAWKIAKAALGRMLNDIKLWIQNGFEWRGRSRPMFVQDIDGFLREVADEVLGAEVEKLLGEYSYLCEPFRLDIATAINIEYDRSIDRRQVTCTLTGIIDNIEGFMSGTRGSFSQGGGWNSWFTMTSNPSLYTPVGQYYEARADVGAKIISARGATQEELSFGNGFLSAKECEEAEGSDGFKEQVCKIVTPGQTIQDMLTFNMDSGRQVLVEADEINEIMFALLEQVANRFLNGAASLLDL